MNLFLKLSKLFAPTYIVALGLLYLNDTFLKHSFPGFLTGKLSDITGLFCFTTFWVILFPNFRVCLAVTIALLFSLWNLDISDTIINSWNSLRIFEVHRAKDLTDLLALGIIPFALRYETYINRLPTPKRFRLGVIIGLSSSVIFLNTSISITHKYNVADQKRFKLEAIKKSCDLSKCKLNDRYKEEITGPFLQSLRFTPEKVNCAGAGHTAVMEESIQDGEIYLTLRSISVNNCPGSKGDVQKALTLAEFERIVLSGIKP